MAGAITFVGDNSIVATQSVFTFDDEPIGTAASDRYVGIVVAGTSRTIGGASYIQSVTVNGSAATCVGLTTNESANGPFVGLYIHALATGTTADIVVTVSGSGGSDAFDCNIFVYNITGIDPTPIGGGLFTQIRGGSGLLPGTTLATISLNTVDDGVAFGGVGSHSSGSTSYTWAGLTEDSDTTTFGNNCWSAASLATGDNTPLTVTATPNNGGANMCARSVAFAPAGTTAGNTYLNWQESAQNLNSDPLDRDVNIGPPSADRIVVLGIFGTSSNGAGGGVMPSTVTLDGNAMTLAISQVQTDGNGNGPFVGVYWLHMPTSSLGGNNIANLDLAWAGSIFDYSYQFYTLTGADTTTPVKDTASDVEATLSATTLTVNVDTDDGSSVVSGGKAYQISGVTTADAVWTGVVPNIQVIAFGDHIGQVCSISNISAATPRTVDVDYSAESGLSQHVAVAASFAPAVVAGGFVPTYPRTAGGMGGLRGGMQ